MVTAEIHSSDRATYRRCRRKWNWSSPLRKNLVSLGEQRGPLWLGSGFHFALEDFHGYNKFGDPRRAFDAYVEAFRPAQLPSDVSELVILGNAMLTYYVELWLPHYGPLDTLWVGGVPQVEVDVQIPLNEKLLEWLINRWGNAYAYEWLDAAREFYAVPDDKEFTVVLHLTFDRVTIDEDGRIWGVDYKTAARFASLAELDKNPQASQYYWGLMDFYGTSAEGLIWQQHRKVAPGPPERLKSGDFSLSKSQSTTYSMYRDTILKTFGSIPKGYTEILNHLANQETPEGDAYIRRDLLRRNEAYGRAEQEKLLAEVHEMLSSNLPLYPNPTRDCGWDCNFRDACTAMDDGSDWQYMLDSEFVAHSGYDDSWRAQIQFPEGG